MPSQAVSLLYPTTSGKPPSFVASCASLTPSQIAGQDRQRHYGVRKQDSDQMGGLNWPVQEPPSQEDGCLGRCLGVAFGYGHDEEKSRISTLRLRDPAVATAVICMHSDLERAFRCLRFLVVEKWID
jgi:hypothetical protein